MIASALSRSVCRTWSAVKAHEPTVTSAPPVRVAVVTTWAEKCGIADYASSLVASATRAAPQLEFTVLAADGTRATGDDASPRVVPSWSKGGEDVSRLVDALRRLRPSVVHVQFQYGFFPVEVLGAILEAARSMRIPSIVQLHKVTDPESKESLSTVAPALARADRLYIHNAADRQALARLGLDDGAVRLVPIGQATLPDEGRASARAGLGLDGYSHIVASFGFLLPHKGIAELVASLPRLLCKHPGLLLVLPCALYPSYWSVRYLRTCRLLASSLGVGSRVLFITEYLPMSSVAQVLHASDVIVLPYLDTGESASAAIRTALSAGRPVVATRQSAFDEVRDKLMTIENAGPVTIAHGVSAVLADPDLSASLAARARESAEVAAWPVVGREYASDLLDIAGARPSGGGAPQGDDG